MGRPSMMESVNRFQPAAPKHFLPPAGHFQSLCDQRKGHKTTAHHNMSIFRSLKMIFLAGRRLRHGEINFFIFWRIQHITVCSQEQSANVLPRLFGQVTDRCVSSGHPGESFLVCVSAERAGSAPSALCEMFREPA